MKAFLKYFFWVLALTSCSRDPLDITPNGRITMDEVFSDSELTEAYLNKTYQSIRKYGHGYNYYHFLSALSDDAHDSMYPSDPKGMVDDFIEGNITEISDPFNIGVNHTTYIYNDTYIYKRNWEGIRRVNIFLSRVNDINVPNQLLRLRFIAEAKLLRAFFYLDLLRMYGPMPIISSDLTNVTDLSGIKRNTFQECSDFISKDCDEAINEPNLPDRIALEAERGRMTKAVAYAIKSQAKLFNASPLWNESNDLEKWKDAADAAKVAVQNLEKANYSLASDYEKYFYTTNDISSNPVDKETIYEITDWGYTGQVYRIFGNLLFLMHTIPDFGPEKAGNCPSQELVDSYDMIDGSEPILGYHDTDHLQPIINPQSNYNDQAPYVSRDPRFYATVWYNGAHYGNINGREVYIEAFLGGRHGISSVKTRTPTGYYQRKWLNPSARNSPQSTGPRYRLYRLAELYLNLAEAENEANGPTAVAYEAVNKVRHRAGMPDFPLNLSKEEFRRRIRKERRVEMALEENRFYDIRRWKILDEFGKVTTGMEWTKDQKGNLTNRRIVTINRKSWEDRFLLMPIPADEITKLPSMKQNPGY